MDCVIGDLPWTSTIHHWRFRCSLTMARLLRCHSGIPLHARLRHGRWVNFRSRNTMSSCNAIHMSDTVADIPVWGCFLFYTCCCAATFVFTYFFVPETKGELNFATQFCFFCSFFRPLRAHTHIYIQLRTVRVLTREGIPIESMDTLFSGPVRYAAFRQKTVYPPDGIPPLPDRVAAHAAYLTEGIKQHDEKHEHDSHHDGGDAGYRA
jgi:hypothetical protein